MGQMISSRSLNAEAHGQSQAMPCMMYGVQSGTGIGFCPSTWVFSPVGIISHGLLVRFSVTDAVCS